MYLKIVRCAGADLDWFVRYDLELQLTQHLHGIPLDARKIVENDAGLLEMPHVAALSSLRDQVGRTRPQGGGLGVRLVTSVEVAVIYQPKACDDRSGRLIPKLG